MPEFVWNDETVVNSYGFRVRNTGGDFKRFDSNPVMQNSHVNTTAMNLGKWKDRKVDGFQLKGSTVFDSARDTAKEVEGQVEREFIKACSMGLAIGWDEDSWLKAPDGVWELVKWELMEVSICAVPSLSSALALYDKATGELIAEDQIKLSVQNLSANDLLKLNTPTMEKIILSTAALSVLVGLSVPTDNITPSEISNAFVKLNADLDASTKKVTELQGKLDAQVKLQAEALVNQAFLDEKITESEKADLLADAMANYALTAKLVAKLPGKVSLSGKVDNATAGQAEFKTLADFQKAPVEKQLSFKRENPEGYKALFAK